MWNNSGHIPSPGINSTYPTKKSVPRLEPAESRPQPGREEGPRVRRGVACGRTRWCPPGATLNASFNWTWGRAAILRQPESGPWGWGRGMCWRTREPEHSQSHACLQTHPCSGLAASRGQQCPVRASPCPVAQVMAANEPAFLPYWVAYWTPGTVLFQRFLDLIF